MRSIWDSVHKEKSDLVGFVGLTLIVLVSLLFLNSRFNFFSRAQELKMPQGFDVIAYLDALKRIDFNHDGSVNTLDGITLQRLVADQTSLPVSDLRFGSKYSAQVWSFYLAQQGINIAEAQKQIFSDPEFAKEATKLISQKNEVVFTESAYDPASVPSFSLSAGTSTATQGEEGSDTFGRTIIPSVLGTVSDFTGAATFSYPIQMPTAASGFGPSVSLGYSSLSIDDARINEDQYFLQGESYTPYFAGYGFSVEGVGAIVRDTVHEKNVISLKGKSHHRFILSLPGGQSAELKYNGERWVSIPQSFLKIDRTSLPGTVTIENGIPVVDGEGWVITTKDGTKYFFGEEKVAEALSTNGRYTSPDTRDFTEDYGGTEGANAYVEFDTAHLCPGEKEENPCDGRKEKDRAVLITKWLLKKIESTDGKIISYSYDVNQKKLEGSKHFRYYLNGVKSDTNERYIDYISSSSYPKSISWSGGLYQVRFEKEKRDDQGKGNLMRYRLKKIIVEGKTPKDPDTYTPMQSYVLNYFSNPRDVGTTTENKQIESVLGAHLQSVTQYGTDDKIAQPPVSFAYKQFNLTGREYGRGDTYLSLIRNGFGGETVFDYQPYEIGFYLQDGRPYGKLYRNRVVGKTIRDLSDGNKSSAQIYRYSLDPTKDINLADVNNAAYFAKPIAIAAKFRKNGPARIEFIGHRVVDVISYDFSNTPGVYEKVLGHTRTVFHQSILSQKPDGTISCMNEHPLKGRPEETITYDVDRAGGAKEYRASDTYNLYGIRQVAYDKNTNNYSYLENPPDALTCKTNRVAQPYFVHQTDIIIASTQQPNDAFLPTSLKSKIENPKSTVITKESTPDYDVFGNALTSISWGEVDEKGVDKDPKDNRYTYSAFYTDGGAWLKGLPRLTYTSASSACDENTLACQYGRTKYFYDLFDTVDYTSVASEKLQPTVGLLTHKEVSLTDTQSTINRYEYEKVSQAGTTFYGNIIATYGPKPNAKVSRPSDLQLISKSTYDDFYHSLITKQENGLGQVVSYEDYDYQLQQPQTRRVLVDKNKNTYLRTKIEYDSFGRATKVYNPHPKLADKTVSFPSTQTAYFSAEGKPLVMRTFSYNAEDSANNTYIEGTDTFYDGYGNIKQTQKLNTLVDGQQKRLTTQAQYDAAGRVIATYDVYADNPVTITRYDISKPSPSLVTVPQVVVAQSTYDRLGRPTEQKIVDAASGQALVTKSEYQLLSTKVTTPKGVQTISMTDSLGRSKQSITIDNSQNTAGQVMITDMKYGQELIDKPTQITYTAYSNTVPESSVSTTYAYNKAGQVISYDEPSLGKNSFEYDVLGNVLKEYKDTNNEIIYTYDSLGRMVKKHFVNAYLGNMNKRSKTDDIIYTYDQGENALGKLSTVTDFTGETSFSYTLTQQLRNNTQKIFDKTYSSDFSYGILGQKTESSYPGSNKVAYDYDEDGSIMKVSLNGRPLLQKSSFSKYGAEKNVDITLDGSSYSFGSEYDGLNRIQDLLFKKADGSGLFQQHLSYNPFGEIDMVQSQSGSNSQTDKYYYDGFSQLVDWDGGTVKGHYVYDPFGRILEKTENDSRITYGYTASTPFFAPKSMNSPTSRQSSTEQTDSQTPATTPLPSPTPVDPTVAIETPTPSLGYERGKQRTLPVPIETQSTGPERTQPLTYTEKGVMKEDNLHCYTYNRLNQVVSIRTKKPGTTTCSNRVGEQAPEFTQTEYFYYDYAGNLVLQEVYAPSAPDDPIKQTYIFGNYEEIVEKGKSTSTRLSLGLSKSVSAVKNDDQISLMIKDYLGSTRAIVDTSGVKDIAAYLPYGGEKTSGELKKIRASTNTLFTGQRKTDTQDLYHFGARFYNTQLGLFIQPDPVEGPNRYSYAMNNPVTYNDPSGNISMDTRGSGVSSGPSLSLMSTSTNRLPVPGNPSVYTDSIWSSEKEQFKKDLLAVGLGVGVGGAIYVGYPAYLAVSTVCLANMPTCMDIGSGVLMGDALPPGQSLVSAPAAAVSGGISMLDDAARASQKAQNLDIFNLLFSSSRIGVRIKGRSFAFDTLDEAKGFFAEEISKAVGQEVTVVERPLYKYIAQAKRTRGLKSGYKHIAQQDFPMLLHEVGDPALARAYARETAAYQFFVGDKMVAELYGLHTDPATLVTGGHYFGTPWNFRITEYKKMSHDIYISGYQLPEAVERVGRIKAAMSN